MSAFVDQERERFAVELICRTLGVSLSAYYRRATGERSARAVEDERLLERIRALPTFTGDGFSSKYANLFHPLSPLQLLGVWPSGDFRITPDPAWPLPARLAGRVVRGVAAPARGRRRRAHRARRPGRQRQPAVLWEGC